MSPVPDPASHPAPTCCDPEPRVAPRVARWAAPWTLPGRRHWPALLILALALGLRLVGLDSKPPHFDEGVNGSFVDQMTLNGFYHYNPGNFHGPLHFYGLFLAQTLFGRHIWALRLPIALLSTGCVGLALMHRRHLGKTASHIAALAMALSPGMVFYGRYAIHETWLLFFLLLTSWGGLGLWSVGLRRHLWAVVLGLCGMVLTKETYAVHFVAIFLSIPSLLLLQTLSPSAPRPWSLPLRHWQHSDLLAATATAFGLLVFFYSGGFLDFPSLRGLWETYARWFATGTEGQSGHEKEWSYWLKLLLRYEWPALLGLLAAPWVLVPNKSARIRLLAIYGLGALCAYSLIAYKTPWCLIVLMWPFQMLFGVAIDRAFRGVDRLVTSVVSLTVLSHSYFSCFLLNFRESTNPDAPYVYVQTLPELMEKLIQPLHTLTRRDPQNYQLRGYVITAEQYPLSWLLGDFTTISYLPADQPIETIDRPDFIIADETLAADLEARLDADFFKEHLKIRGNAATSEVLYLRVKAFRSCFPERSIELVKAQAVSPTTNTEDDLGKLP